MSAAGKFQYPTGREGAEKLGYDAATIKAAGQELLDSFCGVGNPFSLGPVRSGEIVLDIGCGAGFDLFVAAGLVGKNGRACGIDLTLEMVNKASRMLTRAGVTNFEIEIADAAVIPYNDDTFDLVMSNGVINLSPNKDTCFKEILRVLKPGGRIQFADVVLEQDLPQGVANSAEAWSQ